MGETLINTVGELIEKLSEFDRDMPIGGSGHFGERLKIEDVYRHKGHEAFHVWKNQPPFVVICIEWAGPDPDEE